MRRSLTVAAGLASIFCFVTSVSAADVKVMSTGALKPVLEELRPQFEKLSGHALAFTWGEAARMKGQIESGAAFDVAILTVKGIDDLVAAGKLVASTRTPLARSGIGVAVRKGAPEPDVSTTEAFRRTLLNATSIGYAEQSASGAYLKGLFVRLGIENEIKAKIKVFPGNVAKFVAQGDAEIGITQISAIRSNAGVELAGPLPPDIQLYTVFAAAVGAASTEPEAARALINLLTSPAAASVRKTKGLDPPT